MTTATISPVHKIPVDAKAVHQQIVQLENMHRLMQDGPDAQTVASTLQLLHQIEEELRHQARVEHPVHH